jgi:predicted dienelactone hydrolase
VASVVGEQPRSIAIALFAAVCFSATLAQAAGLRFIEVPADAAGPALRGAVWYPCDAPAGAIALGPAITLQGTKDCPMKVGQWPLVVISHGAGGSFIAHRDTAAALADAGFVAAAISHAGDNFQDLSAHEDLSIFVSRPMDMKRLIDFVLKRWPEHIDADSIGFFGFSRGGYTGLALAGADGDRLPCAAGLRALRLPRALLHGQRHARDLQTHQSISSG